MSATTEPNVRTYEVPYRFYPVKVTSTLVHFVWVAADSPQEAVESAQYDTHELIGSADPDDAWQDVEAPDEFDTIPDESERLGPNLACAECGAVEDHPGALRWARHPGHCSSHRHRADLSAVRDGRETVGWVTRCSCQADGFAFPYLSVALAEVPPGATVHRDRETPAAILREHVAGRPHSQNVPLGIPDDL